tara:strand:- start:2138 stop:2725 length:588 start_codon:yes stop_codon:yes gene_type:complete
MKSIQNYIISTKNRYNNKINIDEKELILNTEINERDHVFVNRIGTVTSIPLDIKSPIQEGDKVIVHHNVFRKWIDIRGDEQNSTNFLSEDTYFVTPDQVFAYKNNNQWKATDGYCFVKPLYKEDKWALKIDENLKGELIYSDSNLDALNVSCGDIVGFTPDSEYEFTIENTKLYRILSNHITINYGAQTENNFSS